MFIRLLNDADKELFAKVAYLLSLADNPLLWNGKTREEVSANDDFSRLGIQKDEAEMALLKEWGIDVEAYRNERVYDTLLARLKNTPFSRVEDEASRGANAAFVLEALLSEEQKQRGFASPAIPKVMLYHLMLMALSDGHITLVEEALLQLFSEHAQIPDFIYEEIQERAEAAHKEIQKTLAIILE